MKISVFGLGYVGCVSAACLADKGNHIIGVDISEEKVNLINIGKLPILEDGVEDILRRNVTKGNLCATTDAKKAVLNSDISLISVGTPSRDDGSLNLEFVYRVVEQIGKALRYKEGFHIIAIRSTILPGTVEKCSSIIEETSGKKLNSKFGMASNPEFLREGSAVRDFYSPPYTVIGATSERVADILAQLYKFVDAPIIRTEVKVAEMIKYASNAFHALKVGFANEMGSICKELGIDSHKVMDIFCQDDKLNLSSYYLKPGFAFGGSCLPKDTRALIHKANDLGLRTPILDSIMPSNEEQINRALRMIKQARRSRIGILGLSFKGGTDDLRESPMVKLAKKLLQEGCDVKFYDPDIVKGAIMGSNKAYIEEVIPNFDSLMCSSLSRFLNETEVYVIGKRSDVVSSIIDQAKRDQSIIIDLVRMRDELEAIRREASYEGIGW